MSNIYSLTLTQRITGKPPLLGVYFYRTADVNDPQASALWAGRAFVEDVLPHINALQIVGVTNSTLEVFNLFNPLDIASLGLTGGGVLAGTLDNNADAIGFRSQRTRRDIRRGGKRIGGIPDVNINDDVVAAGFLPAVQTLAARLHLTMIASGDPNLVSYWPVVVHRIFTGIVNGRRRYRLPATALEARFFFWEATEYSTIVRTQSSRRYKPLWASPP